MQLTQEYCSDKGLEARYGLRRRFWQKLRFQGEGPVYRKVNRCCLYRFSDVEAWLAHQPLMRSTAERAA
jgi:hypothetical protein